METEEKQINGPGDWQSIRENGRSYLMQEDIEDTDHSKKDEEEEWEQLEALSVRGLLPCHICYRNGKRYRCYDITGKQSLSEYYQEREISFQDCRSLLMSMDRLLCQMYECLLSEEKLQLVPDRMYVGMEEKDLWLVYGKDTGEGFSGKIRTFAEYLLSRVDHKDDNAVTLAYQFYKYASSENFNMGEFLTENRAHLHPKEEAESVEGAEGVDEADLSDREADSWHTFLEGSDEYYDLHISDSEMVWGRRKVRQCKNMQRQEMHQSEDTQNQKSMSIKKCLPVLLLLPLLVCSILWSKAVCDRIRLLGAGTAYIVAVILYYLNRYRRKGLEKKEQSYYREMIQQNSKPEN